MNAFIIDINEDRKNKFNEIVRDEVRIADLIEDRIQNHFSHFQIIVLFD